MVKLVVSLALFMSSLAFSQTKSMDKEVQFKGRTVTVTVINARNDNGKIRFALYNRENFLKQPIIARMLPIKDGKSSVEFKGLEKGEYAVLCYHDENGNGQMDFEENGMPKEDYGASNNIMTYGPPQFDTSKFKVTDKDLKLEIKF